MSTRTSEHNSAKRDMAQEIFAEYGYIKSRKPRIYVKYKMSLLVDERIRLAKIFSTATKFTPRKVQRDKNRLKRHKSFGR